MDNPWKNIRLSDYENHMSLGSVVMQLQTLGDIMKRQLDEYPGGDVMILGCAGGNGLEHIDRDKYKRVYCVDINPEYLRETAKRYEGLGNSLKCLCIDLTGELSGLPPAGLVIADLLIEYIGYECFGRVIGRVCPEAISCVIQADTGEGFVSASPYAHCFEGLEGIHYRIDRDRLSMCMGSMGYAGDKTAEFPLPNGKKLVMMNFVRTGGK